MKLGLVLTDLDGTLLETDGSICPEARQALDRCRDVGVAVCPVTSKTPDELASITQAFGLSTPAGFENGAGVRLPDGQLELTSAAVPVAVLREVVGHLRRSTGMAIDSIEDLDDDALASLTQLPRALLPLVRRRHATLPLVVPAAADGLLRAALPDPGRLRLVRGNRFLHLQGSHTKADAVDRLVALAGHPAGAVVTCGDSPNDLELLERGDVAVIVPGAGGPNPELRRAFPDAIIAQHPHGRGWAAVILAHLQGGPAT